MLKFLSTLLLLSFCFVLSSPLRAQSKFSIAYGGTANEIFTSLARATSGKYVLTGKTANFGAGGNDMFAVKIDKNGDTTWTNTYGGILDDEANGSQQTIPDGGLILAGQTKSFGEPNGDFYLVKTDSNGTHLWSKTYGGNGIENAYSIRQTMDRGFIIAGETNSFGAGGYDMYIVKTDSVGAIQWTVTVGGTGDETARSIKTIGMNGGYIVVGSTTSYGANPGATSDIYLVKLSSSGAVLWKRTIGGVNDEWGTSVERVNQDGSFIVGGTTDPGTGMTDMCLIRTDSTGIVTLAKNYGGANAESLIEAVQTTGSNAGILMIGRTNSFGAGNNDVYLVKTDPGGNVLWSKALGGAGADEPGEVRQNATTGDSSYIISGLTSSFGSGANEGWVVKVDKNGNAQCDSMTAATIVTTFIPAQDTGGVAGTGSTMGSPATISSRTPTVITTQCFDPGCTTIPGFTFTPNIICSGKVVTFNNTSTGATSYSWEINGAQFSTSNNPTHTFSTAGNQTVTLVATGPTCTDSMVRTVVVNQTPTAAITQSGTINICDGDSVTLQGSGGPTWRWYENGVFIPGSMTQNYTVYQSGSYTLRVRSSVGCTDSTIVPVIVNVNPTPAPSFTVSQTGLTVTITNTSAGGSGSAWDLGDGNTSTQTNPVHTYTTAGTYIICLTETSAQGCDSTACNSTDVGVSIEGKLKNNQISVYPNPAKNTFRVKFSGSVSGDELKVELYDMMGIKVKEMISSVQNEIRISREALPAGAYFVRISTEGNWIGTSKMVFE